MCCNGLCSVAVFHIEAERMMITKITKKWNCLKHLLILHKGFGPNSLTILGFVETLNNAIQCQDDSDYIKIARCYCIYYYDRNTNRSQFGSCLATCFHPQLGAYFSVKRYSVENATKQCVLKVLQNFNFNT